MSASSSASPKRFRFRRWILIVLALLIVLAVVGWVLVRMTPSWYVPLDPTSQRVIDLMEQAQNSLDIRLSARLHNAMESVPLGEQSWSISQDEVNALIASRSEGWKGGGVTGPLVVFTPGKITLAARSKHIPSGNSDGGVGSVVISVLHTPAETPFDLSSNAIKIHGAWLGCLPVPKSIVESRLAAMAPEIIAAVQLQMRLQVGSSQQLKNIEPVLTGIFRGEPLPPIDPRRVVIKEIRVDDGVLTIVFTRPVKPLVPKPK